MNNSMVYSFDIFDTVIGRYVSVPADIFDLVQAKLIARGGFPEAMQQDFRIIRQSAESNARKQNAQSTQREDIHLEDIYDFLQTAQSLTPERRQWLQQCEFDTELENTRPIPENIQRICDLRAAGERVIFISDMYLGEARIRRLLVKASQALRDVPMYVSCDAGYLKRTGNLFLHVLKQEKLTPHELLHRGDNPVGDRDIPAKLGIRTDFYAEKYLFS